MVIILFVNNRMLGIVHVDYYVCEAYLITQRHSIRDIRQEHPLIQNH